LSPFSAAEHIYQFDFAWFLIFNFETCEQNFCTKLKFCDLFKNVYILYIDNICDLTAGTTCGAGTVYPFRVPEFIPGFMWVRVTRSSVFYAWFWISFFVLFLLAIVLNALLWYTASYYLFGISKLFILYVIWSLMLMKWKWKELTNCRWCWHYDKITDNKHN